MYFDFVEDNFEYNSGLLVVLLNEEIEVTPKGAPIFCDVPGYVPYPKSVKKFCIIVVATPGKLLLMLEV